MEKRLYTGSVRNIARQFQEDERLLLKNLVNFEGAEPKELAKGYAAKHPEKMGYIAIGRMRGQAWNPWTGGAFYHIFRGRAEEVHAREALQREDE